MKKRSLGTTIRAARLGWGFSERHNCFIRMSDDGKNTTMIELCPADDIPSKKTKYGTHRVWWDEPDLLNLLPWLKPVREVKAYIAVIVGDSGEIIKPLTGIKP